MKNYTVTVNGNVYDVVVEEGKTAGAAPKVPIVAESAPVAEAITPVPVSEASPADAGIAGEIEVVAGAAGKVFKIAAPIGTAVKAGEAVVIIEAMKMEIPMNAPQDGTVASIDVSVGDMVEGGTLLATLN